MLVVWLIKAVYLKWKDIYRLYGNCHIYQRNVQFQGISNLLELPVSAFRGTKNKRNVFVAAAAVRAQKAGRGA